MHERAQLETEFIIIFGVLFLFIILVLSLHTVTLDALSRHQAAQDAETALRQVSSAVTRAAGQGKGSVQTTRINLPQGITSAVVSGTTMQYTINKETITTQSPIPLNGTLPVKPGTFIIKVEARDGYAQIS